MKRTIFSSLLLAVAVALSGCSGGEDSGGGAGHGSHAFGKSDKHHAYRTMPSPKPNRAHR